MGIAQRPSPRSNVAICDAHQVCKVSGSSCEFTPSDSRGHRCQSVKSSVSSLRRRAPAATSMDTQPWRRYTILRKKPLHFETEHILGPSDIVPKKRHVVPTVRGAQRSGLRAAVKNKIFAEEEETHTISTRSDLKCKGDHHHCYT